MICLINDLGRFSFEFECLAFSKPFVHVTAHKIFIRLCTKFKRHAVITSKNTMHENAFYCIYTIVAVIPFSSLLINAIVSNNNKVKG